MKNTVKTIMMLNAMLAAGCSQQSFHQFSSADNKAIFPKGKLGPALNFTSKAWNTALVNQDSTFTTVIGNVYFEPEPVVTGTHIPPDKY